MANDDQTRTAILRDKTTIMSKDLSKQLLKDMQHNIDIVKAGEKTFISVGEALRKLRDDGLYKAKYGTFEELCKAEFNKSTTHAYDLIQGAAVVGKLSAIADTEISGIPVFVPENESQARAFSAVAKDDESLKDLAVAVGAEKAATSKPVTAKVIKDVAAKTLNAKSDAKPRKPGQPSGGTKFDPSEWTAEASEEPEAIPETPVGKIPPHLTEVISGLKAGHSLVRDIQLAMRNAKAYVETPSGAWLAVKWSNFERDLKQIEMDAKLTQFECNCPNCKNKVTRHCGKCGGRGWIDKRHAAMLTNEERKWVEDNK